jgi:hypothetical protein
VAGGGDRDQVGRAHRPVGGIEGDPARTRHQDLDPGWT